MTDDMFEQAYHGVQKALDYAIGTHEESGAGAGIVADAMLLAQRYMELRAAVLAGEADPRTVDTLEDPRRTEALLIRYEKAVEALRPVEGSTPIASPAQCGHGIAVAGAWLRCQNTPDHDGLHISGRRRWRTGGTLEPADPPARPCGMHYSWPSDGIVPAGSVGPCLRIGEHNWHRDEDGYAWPTSATIPVVNMKTSTVIKGASVSRLCGNLSIVDPAGVPPQRSCELPAGHGGWHEAAQLPFAPLRWVHAEQLRGSKIGAPAGEAPFVGERAPVLLPVAAGTVVHASTCSEVARRGKCDCPAGEVVSVPPPARPFATGGIITDPPLLLVAEPEAGCTLTVPPPAADRSPSLAAPVAAAYGAPADEPAPVPPPVDALLERVERVAYFAHRAARAEMAADADKAEQHNASYRIALDHVAADLRALYAAGVEEGRRQLDAEIHANVFTSARLAAAEAGFGMVPESVTVSYLTPDIRAVTLIEAYWKLRDHAAGLRDTEVYRKASERKEGTLGESPAFQRYRWLEATARGIEDGATDLAKLLGVDEFDIERPVNRG